MVTDSDTLWARREGEGCVPGVTVERWTPSLDIQRDVGDVELGRLGLAGLG